MRLAHCGLETRRTQERSRQQQRSREKQLFVAKASVAVLRIRLSCVSPDTQPASQSDRDMLLHFGGRKTEEYT